MRIALVHMRHAPIGGAERYLDQLATFLAECGHDVAIVCRTHADPSHPGVRFVPLRSFAPGRPWRTWAFARAVERHVARTPYDLVVALGKTWTHDVIRLGGGCHATYLERAHAATQRGWERALALSWPKDRVALAIERRALAPGAARAVIVPSHMVKADVMRRYGVPDAAIHVIPNGVDLERFRPASPQERRAAREALGCAPEDDVLLFLGSGFGRKGLDRVLDALPALVRRRPRTRLLVVGRDSGWRHFFRRAQRLGLADRVSFLGSRDDPERCYAAADLYVLPTRYDSFAYTVLEAFASGIPVVTTEDAGAAELVEDGVHGAVLPSRFPPGALARALFDWTAPGRREKSLGALRASAESHSRARCLEATWKVLEAAAAIRASAATPGGPAYLPGSTWPASGTGTEGP